MLDLNRKYMQPTKQISTLSIVQEEIDLVQGLRQGNRKAHEVFYKTYFGKMFPVALRYSSSKEDAKEIINTAFLKVIKSIGRYNDQNFGGWVRTIVQRTAIDHCRKYTDKEPSKVEILEVDEKSYNEALSSLRMEELLKHIQMLPDAHRTVFSLYVFEQLTHTEIAKKLNIPKGTSKWHLSKARKLLIQTIQQ